MISWRKNLFWVWLSLFLAMTGFGFAYPILPFFLKDELHITDPETRDIYVGLFAFSGNFGFLLFSPLWGKLADIYGRKTMMTRANFCSALLLPLLAFAPDPVSLTVVRFLIGAFAGVAAAAMTLVACSTPQRHRGMAMGAISSAMFSGMLAGMVVGGFCASLYGYTATFMICGALLLGAALISYYLIVERASPPRSGEGLNLSFKFKLPRFGLIWWLMLLTLGMGYVQQMDGPYLPVLVEIVLKGDSDPSVSASLTPLQRETYWMASTGDRLMFGLPPEPAPMCLALPPELSAANESGAALRWSGILGGACAASGIFGGFIIGAWADRYPGNKVGLIVTLIAAVFLLPQAFCSNLGLLFAERMVMIFFISGLSPIMQSWLSLTTAPEDRGEYFGYATSFRAIGWLLGGAVGMLVTPIFGTRSVFLIAGISMLVLAYLIVAAQKRIPYPRIIPKRIKSIKLTTP